MINLFKVKEKNKENAAAANGKPAVKKQSPGELRLHKGLLSWKQLNLILLSESTLAILHTVTLYFYFLLLHMFQILLN
jgi:hypothetical protein